MRKLRTCPARAGSDLEVAEPVFQRACNIEPDDAKSALPADTSVVFGPAAALSYSRLRFFPANAYGMGR